MSASSSSRPSDVAARKVEQIVLAAQEAADGIRGQAESELEEIRATARRKAEAELTQARKDAIMLTEDARRDAELIIGDARAQSDELREKTRRAIQGRVAAAEVAAAEVLDEARALSAGLNQLARSLSDQAERILRDVQAAHQRMQGDLRIDLHDEAAPSRPDERRTPSTPRGLDDAGSPAVPPRRRANPFDELEVPSWER